jgi:hypothetical protein
MPIVFAAIAARAFRTPRAAACASIATTTTRTTTGTTAGTTSGAGCGSETD